jgi:hypothetical protein
MRRLFIAVLTVFGVFAAMPQILRAWSPTASNATVSVFGGSGSSSSKRVAVDTSGNMYVTGYFLGTADFDPGAGTANLTAGETHDAYVVKLDASGTYVWARQFGGYNFDFGNGVAVDASGNVYVTGDFFGTADFDPGTGTANLTSAGGSDAFVVKLNASGTYVWARQFGGSTSDSSYGVAVDASGNTYITGDFFSTADFDPGAGTANMESAGGTDAFVVKLNASGTYVWARQLGGTSYDYGFDVAVDASGNTYVTGSFFGTADFDPGAGTANLTIVGNSPDAYAAKLDASGTYVWARQFGGSSLDQSNGVAVDAFRNVYVTGFFDGTADFDPGAGTANLTSAGRLDAYVVKLESSGTYVWARQFGGSSNDYSYGVAVDASGNTYVTGNFGETADFDPGAGTANLTSAGSFDAYVVKLDASGTHIWARQFGGSNTDYGNGVAVDASGNTYVTGSFFGTADFDPGAGTANLTSTGDNSAYVVKLSSSGTTVLATTSPATTIPATTIPATTVPAARQSTPVVTLPPKLGRVQQVQFKYTLKEPYQATIRWSKPKGAGDRLITYSVYREGQKRAGWLCRTYQLSCLITNLYPDREYRFFVEATSSSRQTTSSFTSKTLLTRLPNLEREELKPPTGGRDFYGKSCNARLQNKSLNYWPIKSIPGFVRLQSDCSGRVLFMSKTPVQISPTILTRQKSPLGNPEFYIRDDALELSLSSAYADKLLVEKALNYIYKQSSLRRWEITPSISYPSGCVAQRNDFVFKNGQVWNWFLNTPGWGRNCEVRLRKDTIGVQTKTIRLRWTYPTVCIEANCDVNLNQFNEPELSYLRLVIVIEN